MPAYNPQLLLQLSVSALSCVCVRDKPLPSVPSREHNSTNNDAFLPPLPACWSSDFKARTQQQSKPCSVCIYLPVSVTIRQIGVCVAAVIGPLCSASGPSLIFITRFINKQINRDTFLERMKEAGVFLSLEIIVLYIYKYIYALKQMLERSRLHSTRPFNKIAFLRLSKPSTVTVFFLPLVRKLT